MEMIKKEIFVFLLAMAPVSELRGAIPYGISQGLPLSKTILLSIGGNLLPVIPVYFFIKKILAYLERFKYTRKFSLWIANSTKRRSRIIEIYETIGLVIFVGIPLPVTGAWTGTIAASLFGLKFKNFIIGVSGGILLACLIVSTLTLGVRKIL